MDPLSFAARLDMLSVDEIPRPQPSKISRKAPSVAELDAIELPDYGLTNSKSTPRPDVQQSERSLFEANGKKTPNELEDSQPPTPTGDAATGIVPSWSYPTMNKWRHLSACLEYFGNGMNDSAPGALIPYIESAYGIGYAVVSLIWIANAMGFILAAFSNDFIDAKLGRAKSLMLSEVIMIAAYTVIACPVLGPLPCGRGGVFRPWLWQCSESSAEQCLLLESGQFDCYLGSRARVVWGRRNCWTNRSYRARLEWRELASLLSHYNVSSITKPFLPSLMQSSGIRVLCFAATGWSFWNYEKEEITRFSNSLVEMASRQSATDPARTSKFKSIAKALKIRTTIIGALFIFAYQGIEVSESGWFITYVSVGVLHV